MRLVQHYWVQKIHYCKISEPQSNKIISHEKQYSEINTGIRIIVSIFSRRTHTIRTAADDSWNLSSILNCSVTRLPKQGNIRVHWERESGSFRIVSPPHACPMPRYISRGISMITSLTFVNLVGCNCYGII